VLTVIGDPALNRTQFFLRAAGTAGVPAGALPYSEILAEGSDWPRLLAGRLVKLESPGRDFAVHRRLLQRGGVVGVEPGCSHWPVDRLPAAEAGPGLVYGTRQWYLGWRNLLEEVAARGGPAGAEFLNAPADIAEMFDKPACHARLRAAGVPVPDALASPRSCDDLYASLEAARWHRVFLKSSHGSAANGVIALARHHGRVRAYTALELAAVHGEDRLYSTRRLRLYDDPAVVRRLIEALCRERVHVERWIPKAGLDGRTADVRVVVIGGRACHLLVRLAEGPITNLHLGALKAGEEALAATAGNAAVARLRSVAERAAACYPASFCVGVDLALTPDFRRALVLEVNAFGDLLEGWLWQGADTYTWQVRLIQERRAARAAAQVSCTGA